MSSDDNQNQTALQLAKEQLAQANEALETTKKRLVALQRVIVTKSLDSADQELKRVCERVVAMEFIVKSLEPMNPEGHP